MKRLIAISISSLLIILSSFAANAIKIGAIYLDSQGFYGGIQKGIMVAGAEEGIELLGNNSQADVTKESEFIDQAQWIGEERWLTPNEILDDRKINNIRE